MFHAARFSYSLWEKKTNIDKAPALNGQLSQKPSASKSDMAKFQKILSVSQKPRTLGSWIKKQ